MSTSPNLGLTLMSASQAQKEIVFNEFLIAMDALFKGSVKSASLTSPPGSPADGDAYVVGGSASGAWSGQDYAIAFYFNGWQFVSPPLKLKLFNEATGNFITYQGPSTHWTVDPTSTVSVLGDLTNVSGSPTDGQVLTWDNTAGKWKPVTPAFSGQLIALSDVAVTEGPGIDGQALYWDNGAGKWKTKAVLSSVSAPTFLSLSDVDHTGASNGWVLVYNSTGPGAHFVNPTTLTSVATLNNVGDVSYAAGLHTGDVLTWNGAAWGPATYVNVYSFLGMTDGPGTMSGAAGKILRVNSIENALEYVSPGLALGLKLEDMTDVQVTPGSGIDGYVLYWKNTDSKWEAQALSWANLSGKPTLFSGNYADLAGKPSLFSGAYSDLTGKPSLFSGAYADLTGLPTLFSGNYADLAGKPTIPTKLKDLTGSVNVAENSGEDGKFLKWDNGTGKWIAATASTTTSLAALTDVSMSPGSGTDGYVVYWNNASTKFKLKAVSGGGGSSTLATLTDVNVTEGAGIDGKFLKWDNATSKWVAATPSGGGGGGGGGNGLTPPISTDFTAVVNNPNNDTFIDRSVDGIPSLALIPAGGAAGSNLYCALEANPMPGAFSMVAKLLTSDYFNGSGWSGAGIVLHNATADKSVYLWYCPNGQFYCADFTGWTTSTVNLGASIGAANDIFLHLDFDGTNIKFGLSKNGIDAQWPRSESLASHLGAITHVGLGWGQLQTGATYIWEHFYIGTQGTSGISLSGGGGGGGGGSSTLAGDSDVAITSPTNGQVLTYDTGTSKWKNADLTGGTGTSFGLPQYEQGAFAPPDPSWFSTAPSYSGLSVTLTAAARRGMTMAVSSAASNQLAVAARSVSGWGSTWSVTARIIGSQNLGQYPCFGLAALDTSGKLHQVTTVSQTSSIGLGYGQRYNSNVSYNSTDSTESPVMVQPTWFRIRLASGNLYFATSFDGLSWHEYSASASSWLGTLDKVGLIIVANTDKGLSQSSAATLVTYYDDPDHPAAARTASALGALLPIARYELGALAPPDPSWFTAVSDGSATAAMSDELGQGSKIAFTSLGSGSNQAVWMEKSATGAGWSGNWAVTARIIGSNWTNQYPAFGLALVDSSGKRVTWQVAGDGNGGTQVGVDKWNSPGSYNGGVFSEKCQNRPQWLRIRFDGANWQFGFSYDGLTWSEHAVGPTFIGTLNKVAIGGSAYDGGGSFSLSTAGILVTYYDDPDYPAADRTVMTSARLGDLADVKSPSPSNCDHLSYVAADGVWKNKPTRYDLGVSITGNMTNNEILLQYVAPVSFKIAAGATGSYAKANAAATGSTTVTINKNGTSVGTIVWSASGTSGTFTVASAVTLAAGDILQLVAPSTADATLADIGITLAGTRT